MCIAHIDFPVNYKREELYGASFEQLPKEKLNTIVKAGVEEFSTHTYSDANTDRKQRHIQRFAVSLFWYKEEILLILYKICS